MELLMLAAQQAPLPDTSNVPTTTYGLMALVLAVLSSVVWYIFRLFKSSKDELIHKQDSRIADYETKVSELQRDAIGIREKFLEQHARIQNDTAQRLSSIEAHLDLIPSRTAEKLHWRRRRISSGSAAAASYVRSKENGKD